jgi:UDP-GlcNAc:undecaprenyl-phosphate GlcNAc-1-phosphate transferase
VGSYTFTLVVAWLVALVATPLIIRLSAARGWVDQPTDRKQHPSPVPYTGGVAVFGSAVLAILLVAPWSDPIRSVAWGPGSLSALGAGLVAIVALGVYDDLYDMPAGVKLLGQVAIAIGTWLLGFQSGQLELPFGWVVDGAPALSLVLTVIWIVVVTNAFNLIDGLDGLAAGTWSCSARATTRVSP